MATIGDTVQITVQATLVCDDYSGSMTMAYSDCICTVRDNGKEIGSVGGRLGASYEYQDSATGEIWRINPDTFWHAFRKALEKKED